MSSYVSRVPFITMFLGRSLRSISFVSIFPLRNHRTESLDERVAQPVIYLTVKDIPYRCSECKNFHDFKKIYRELAGFHVLSGGIFPFYWHRFSDFCILSTAFRKRLSSLKRLIARISLVTLNSSRRLLSASDGVYSIRVKTKLVYNGLPFTSM